MTRPPPPVQGVCPVIETPFTPDDEVDYASFDRLIDHLVAVGVRSLMFPGFASEYYKLSDAERTKLTAALLDRLRDVAGFTVVISVPDHSTHLGVQRSIEAVRGGANAINLLPPNQQGPSGDAVKAHVRSIAAAISPTPLILQYAPALTGTALDASTISEIARGAPNLVQVKVESTPPGGLITALAQQDPALSSVVGYAGVQLIDALRRGAVGVQPGCSFSEIYLEIWQRWKSDNQAGAIELHRQLLPYISYWMQGVELLVAAEKSISFKRGLIAADRCRTPMRVLDAEENAMIDRFLVEFGSELSR